MKTETVHAAWCVPSQAEHSAGSEHISTWVLASEPFILPVGAKTQLLLNEILIQVSQLQALASVCHWPFRVPSILSLLVHSYVVTYRLKNVVVPAPSFFLPFKERRMDLKKFF